MQTTTKTSEELRRLEAIVENGLRAFFDVSKALVEIRDRRLFSGTWSKYLVERWGITGKLDWHAPLFDQCEPADELAGLSPELQRRIANEPGNGPIDEKMREFILQHWETISAEDQAAAVNKEERRIIREAQRLTAAEQEEANIAAIVKALDKASRKSKAIADRKARLDFCRTALVLASEMATGIDNHVEEAVAKALAVVRGIRP